MNEERTPSGEITEFGFLVLVALMRAGREGSYGYRIIQDIAEMTDSQKSYAVPSLYDCLRSLQTAGLVEPAGEHAVNGRLRKYYRITSAGQSAVQSYQEAQDRLQEQVRGWLQKPTSKVAAIGGME